jgi:hypothetical protein
MTATAGRRSDRDHRHANLMGLRPNAVSFAPHYARAAVARVCRLIALVK